MHSLINHKGIEETIQFIEKQQQSLDEIKKELVDYINYVKERKFEWNENGSVDDQILQMNNVLDKYGEVISRRSEITKKSESLKKNSEEILNKVNDISKFSGKQCDIDDIHDEIVLKLIELEKEKCNKKVDELKKTLRNPSMNFIEEK